MRAWNPDVVMSSIMSALPVGIWRIKSSPIGGQVIADYLLEFRKESIDLAIQKRMFTFAPDVES